MRDGPVVKCLVKILFDTADTTPEGVLKETLTHSADYTDLPSPYGLKRKIAPNPTSDLAVLKQEDGKRAMVKTIHFKAKMRPEEVRSVLYGKPFVVDWHGQVKTVKKYPHFVFKKLGGFQCRQYQSHAKGEVNKIWTNLKKN